MAIIRLLQNELLAILGTRTGPLLATSGPEPDARRTLLLVVRALTLLRGANIVIWKFDRFWTKYSYGYCQTTKCSHIMGQRELLRAAVLLPLSCERPAARPIS